MSVKQLRKTPHETRRLRAYARARIQGQVLIHNESHLYIAPLNNISAGGFFADKLVTLEAGTEVRIVLRSPKFNIPIQAIGTVIRVVHEGNPGVAVEFTSIPQVAREMIQTAVFENKLETALRIA